MDRITWLVSRHKCEQRVVVEVSFGGVVKLTRAILVPLAEAAVDNPPLFILEQLRPRPIAAIR